MIERIVVLDCETTWLMGPEALPIEQQPRIVEIALAILRRSKGLVMIETFNSLINPGIPIPEESTKITGITDKMVAGAPSFVSVYTRLVDLFFGCRVLIAHNLPFDRAVLVGG